MTCSRPGITATSHGTWGEIELRGALTGAVPIPGFDAAELIRPEPLVEALGHFERDGVRVVLVRIHCAGGDHGGSVAIGDAIEGFSRRGGLVVTYVNRAANSGASVFALRGDLCFMHPDASFAIHRSLGWEGPSLEPAPADAPWLERNNLAAMSVYLERTLTPAALLWDWVHRGPNDHGAPEVYELFAAEAQRLSWVDGIMLPESVAAFVEHIASIASAPDTGKTHVGTPRSMALMRRWLGERVQAQVFQTSNYQSVGTGDDEYATHGLKIRRKDNLTGHEPSLLIDPDGLKIGQKTINEAWITSTVVVSGLVTSSGGVYVVSLNGDSTGVSASRIAMGGGYGLRVNLGSRLPTGEGFNVMLSPVANATYLHVQPVLFAMNAAGYATFDIAFRGTASGAYNDPASSTLAAMFAVHVYNADGTWAVNP